MILTQKELNRFRSKVNFVYLPDGQLDYEACWLWTGKPGLHGHGFIGIQGKKYPVHRLVYMLEIGTIPKGIRVKRKCKNKLCVNPDHLYLETPQIVLLSNEKHRDLLNVIYRNRFLSLHQLSIKYEISEQNVKDILRGKKRKTMTAIILNEIGCTLEELYEKVKPKLTEAKRRENSRPLKKIDFLKIHTMLEQKQMSVWDIARVVNISYNQVNNIKENFKNICQYS